MFFYASKIGPSFSVIAFSVDPLCRQHQPQCEQELNFVGRWQHVDVVLWVQLHRIHDRFSAENLDAYKTHSPSTG